MGVLIAVLRWLADWLEGKKADADATAAQDAARQRADQDAVAERQRVIDAEHAPDRVQHDLDAGTF